MVLSNFCKLANLVITTFNGIFILCIMLMEITSRHIAVPHPLGFGSIIFYGEIDTKLTLKSVFLASVVLCSQDIWPKFETWELCVTITL